MKLKSQLLAVSLVFLGIPWTGCEFLRSNEHALLALQKQGLAATGNAIANGLNNRADLFYSDLRRAREPLDEQSLQATVVNSPPALDGFFDEWQDTKKRRFGGTKRFMDVAVARQEEVIFLALAISDYSKNYDRSGGLGEASGDRVILTTWLNDRRQQYVIATSAPGTVRGQTVGRRLNGAQPESIRGVWVDVPNGYQLEITLPKAIASERLGIHYIDVDDGGVSVRGNIDPLSTAAPPWLIDSPPALGRALSNFDDETVRVKIYDRWGWLLGSSSPSQEGLSAETNYRVTQWLYRRVLEAPIESLDPLWNESNREVSGDIVSALRGASNHNLVIEGDNFWSRYATPVRSDNGVMGVVVVEQPREKYLSLTDTAFEGLLLKGALASLLVALGLFGFASLLSLRISRLNNTLTSLGTEPYQPTLPVSNANDEIDQLARQFNDLLSEQLRLEEYLRALPRALAHEIRTPVAVISSTLEHLKNPTKPEEHTVLLERAQAGLTRLSTMLDAMNEANRLEASLGTETQEKIELVSLFSELVRAYGTTFPEWTFTLDTDNESADTLAAPDLIVQALDKLISNATSYAPRNSIITLRIRRRGLWWRLSVENNGPQLPGNHQILFAPMQSLREKRAAEGHHLGLGLYIVALVAKHHHGEPWARSTESGAEVGFTVKA